MMFPNAVGGHMPFVPTEKQRKAKKEKERQRHNSAPDVKLANAKNQRNLTHSMPVLTEKNQKVSKRCYVSVPDLDRSKEECKDKSFFSTLMNLFHKKKENKTYLGNYSSSPKNSPSRSPKVKHSLPTAQDIYIAKRQRTRTNSSLYSNVVMEAIEEMEEPYEDNCESSDEENSHVQVVLSAVGIDIPRTQYLQEDSLDGSFPGGSLE